MLSKGGSYQKTFGINGTEIDFTGYGAPLAGFVNVFDNDEPKRIYELLETTIPQAGKYNPQLTVVNDKTGLTNTFGLETLNLDNFDFPCALDIPILNDSKFLWPLEYVRITTAYDRYQNWVDNGCGTVGSDWYLQTPVAGTVWDK